MRYIIPLIILLIIVCFLWQGLEKDPNHLPSPLINQPISEFSANDLLKKINNIKKKNIFATLDTVSRVVKLVFNLC